MATSDNVLTKLHDLLLYLIPQLGKFQRDQKFLLADRPRPVSCASSTGNEQHRRALSCNESISAKEPIMITKTHPTFSVLTLAAALGLNTTSPLRGASADSAPFLLDTRNYRESAASTVHTDKRTYLEADTVPGSLRQAIANAAAGETVDFDAGLAPLGDYGGPTQTMALRAGSLAINAAGASALLTDQRSFTRVGAPDIGAYESGNAAGYGVWAIEMIAGGLDASFTGNADEDPTANGIEYALGTSVLISDPTSPNNPEVITNGSGEIEITFGFNPIAAVDTRWIIERSTDLENFTEIYRYDGPTNTGTPQAGISAVVGATSITVTDPNPPSPNVFYRFGAQTAP